GHGGTFDMWLALFVLGDHDIRGVGVNTRILTKKKPDCVLGCDAPEEPINSSTVGPFKAVPNLALLTTQDQMRQHALPDTPMRVQKLARQTVEPATCGAGMRVKLLNR